MYHPSSLTPINENNEINHNEMIDENNINKNNIINKKKSFHNKTNKNIELNPNKSKNNIILNNLNLINSKNNGSINNNFCNNNNNKLKSITKELIFSNEESENYSNSEYEGSEEKSRSFSLDVSSNKINTLNAYTFNTKFCDFNINKEEKKKESFQDVEIFLDNNYDKFDSIDIQY